MPCTTETVPWGGWVRYETAINYVYSQLPVSMLCPYDRRLTPSSVLDDVNRTHPFLAAATDGPIGNAGFVDPAAFLGDLADRDLDPIEAEQPALELVNQLPGTSRRSVSALAESTDLDRPSIEALALAVGEVVTNAVIHGRPPVVLRAWAAEDRVMVVSVLDHGHGPRNPFVGMVPLDTAPAGGLGLHVVYQTCSLVTMSWGESDFTVHLTMRPASDERVSGMRRALISSPSLIFDRPLNADLAGGVDELRLRADVVVLRRRRGARPSAVLAAPSVRGTDERIPAASEGYRWTSRCSRRRAGDERRTRMSGDADKAKGHVKQAVGELTDDDELEREGKIDELAGPGQERRRQGEGCDRRREGQADRQGLRRVR